MDDLSFPAVQLAHVSPEKNRRDYRACRPGFLVGGKIGEQKQFALPAELPPPNWKLLMPCRRGDTPGYRPSAAISLFCATEQRRRLSPWVITSVRRLRALIRLLVGALLGSDPGPWTLDPGSAAPSPVAMGDTDHSVTVSGDGGFPSRSRGVRTSSRSGVRLATLSVRPSAQETPQQSQPVRLRIGPRGNRRQG